MSRNTIESQLRLIVRSLLREASDPELERAIAFQEKSFPRFFQVGGAIERGPDGNIYAQVPEGETFAGGQPEVWNSERGSFITTSAFTARGATISPPPRPPAIPPEQHPDYRPSRKKGTLPPHNPQAPFEKYAFEPQRRRTSKELPEREANTPVEDIVYFELMDHLADNKPVSPEVFELVTGLIGSGQYSDIFEDLPASTPIYRGVAMTVDQMQKYGIPEVPGNAESKNFDVDFAFGKKNATSSWSLDPGKAWAFAMGTAEGLGRGKRIVVLTSTVGAAGRAIPMKGFYAIAGRVGSGYEAEQEVVCLGPVRVSEVFISGQDAV